MVALVDWTVTASQRSAYWAALPIMLLAAARVGSVVIAGMFPLSALLSLHLSGYMGNICRGVFIVSLLNYGQVKEL